jgi:RimJ/RimL family protein N-acetyltransferase
MERAARSSYAEKHPFFRELEVTGYAGGSLQLVEHSMDFAERSLEWVRDRDVAQFMGADFADVSVQTELDRIREILANENEYHWVMRLDGEGIGAVSIHSIAEQSALEACRAGSITFLIGSREHRKRGIASAVIRVILDWAFREAGFRIITARVLRENGASQRTLMKLGFQEDGKEPYEGLVRGKSSEWMKYRCSSPFVP